MSSRFGFCWSMVRAPRRHTGRRARRRHRLPSRLGLRHHARVRRRPKRRLGRRRLGVGVGVGAAHRRRGRRLGALHREPLLRRRPVQRALRRRRRRVARPPLQRRPLRTTSNAATSTGQERLHGRLGAAGCPLRDAPDGDAMRRREFRRLEMLRQIAVRLDIAAKRRMDGRRNEGELVVCLRGACVWMCAACVRARVRVRACAACAWALRRKRRTRVAPRRNPTRTNAPSRRESAATASAAARTARRACRRGPAPVYRREWSTNMRVSGRVGLGRRRGAEHGRLVRSDLAIVECERSFDRAAPNSKEGGHAMRRSGARPAASARAPSAATPRPCPS